MALTTATRQHTSDFNFTPSAQQTRTPTDPPKQNAAQTAKTASGQKRAANGRVKQRRPHAYNEGIIPLLARAVREVEASAHRGKASPSGRTKFHVVALLMREERARMRAADDVSEAERAETLKRLDGVAAILAKAAARDTSLITLLESEAPVSEATRALKRKMLAQAGIEAEIEEHPATAQPVHVPPELASRQVEPTGIQRRMLANPFLAPVLTHATAPPPVVRLANWELLGPLLKSFEQGGGGGACMKLPDAAVIDRFSPRGHQLMPHQARLLESVREGHRSYLLADEPGLGKTAQSVLAASLADAYPLLVVVPNVVKVNWAREAQRWTPHRRVTVIHGDGDDIDPYADIFVVNYDILDRHLSWMSRFGFAGMVIDEAHMIKNVQSQRSRNVLALADRVRKRVPNGRPLMLALTGTPLINDIDDFRAIWRFLGWLELDASGAERPGTELLQKLEANGYTPAEPQFYPAARESVIELGIVRRRKIDVAADLPSKRVVDLPVELDGETGRGIREAERQLAERLVTGFRSIKAGKLGQKLSDEAIIRMVCAQELEDSRGASTGVNVFTMVRQIGQAKARLAADYAAQLVHSVGKVVFFAKHIDVMDQAEQAFAELGLGTVSIRGDQTAKLRQQHIDAFNNDSSIAVAVCSLTAAGVGVNLQASSNVVLAELSWTDAEQTQAIDRVHRIGQAEPVTAWRIVAAQTLDARIAELIDAKSGLAARALDGAEATPDDADSVQLSTLIQMLRGALG